MITALSRFNFTLSFAGLLLLGLLLPANTALADSAFIHPGLLQSREDLQRIKKAVAEEAEPIYSGFLAFSNNPASRLGYKMRGPFDQIGRRPNVHFTEFDQDANAAYQCALMWCITGNRAFAEKSKQILNGWSATLKKCSGADAVLMASLGPFKFINAAELIRYMDAGWSDSDIQQCERMFKNVIYPVTKDFAPFANGNWDTAAMKMNLAIGVFCSDRVIFDAALGHYTNGAGNGSIEHYVINGTGQCQESGRDQAHTQLGLGCLAECCEIAWHQGVNLYGYDDNRLLKGFEYTAAYNLGDSVPFAEMTDRTGRYHQKAISAAQRGRFRPIYEQIYNHYVNRAGIAAPKTQKVVERIRPEGPAPGADHPGFGTLLYTRPRGEPSAKNETAPSAFPAAGKPQFSTEWQWSTLVRNAREHTGRARAFLWIPQNCERLRGVVVAQHNMEEISILENPTFRRALAELNFAEIWVAPPFDHLFRFDQGTGETFEGILDDLENLSGYAELASVPVVPMGHSAAASWPYYFAAWKPERTLAAISVSGQWPYFRDNGAFAPDIWGNRNVDFVPCLETMGEYEAADSWSREGLEERQAHPLMPLSMLACPAEGHFASTDKKAAYLALYIKKAAQYRLPKNWDGNGAPRLTPIDPTKTGWLVDKWSLNRPPSAAAAPVGQYNGNPAEAFWFFDEELAKATEKYEAEYRWLKPQLVGYIQNGGFVPQDDSHLQVTLKFRPQDDGLTFKLAGTFYDAVPAGSPRLAQWTGLPAGAPLGHASGGGRISIDRICGPFEKLAPDTFAVRLQRGTDPNAERYELVFAATHPGDSQYKPAVQQAHMFIPPRNIEGAEQHISFAPIPDQFVGTSEGKLNASSDAGENVRFYVREGPAEVEGDTLKLMPIPPRAKFPLKVTVVAWQYGRASEPRVRTAEPVVRTFSIIKPPARAGESDNGSCARTITSPDGNVLVTFQLSSGGAPRYGIEYFGKPLVLESGLGFEPDFTNGFVVTGVSLNAHNGQWTQVYGERKTVPDNYRELNVDLKHESGRLMRITFRAYNEGAALRYSFPEQGVKEFKFSGELTEFRFPENTFGYEEHGTEGDYQRVNVADIKPYCERPLTLEYANGISASLAEAANEHYPRMLLSPLPGIRDALVTALGGDTVNTAVRSQRNDPTATLRPGDSTPWRLFVVGQTPGGLLERNYLMLNLNPPCALEDVSWIKPGKAMRDTTMTTTNSRAIIDFAATAGLQYVLLDAKWYGSEDAATGDATTVRAPNLDIPEIVRYGREKNVGLILYVDRRQMKKQRDTLFPLYEKWGVKGVKIGFVDVGPQSETAWITQTIQKAAERHLLLNIHDGYRSTGLSRTWPNLLTVEGIQGNEHFPTPEHDCTLPFTRYIAGPGDYTVCYFDNRIKTTHAHQLGMAVISYSALQAILWYDRPGMYHGEPEVEFFREVPTVWDETKVIAGKIGEYASIARRSGDDWFIGSINNSQPRQLELPLTFLAGGRKYLAHVYSDDESAPTRTHVSVQTRSVDSQTTVTANLLPGGGQAVWIQAVANK